MVNFSNTTKNVNGFNNTDKTLKYFMSQNFTTCAQKNTEPNKWIFAKAKMHKKFTYWTKKNNYAYNT